MLAGQPAISMVGAMHIVVCVCTCLRPQMLRRCLEAIARLVRPEGYRLSVVIVDNESEPNNRVIVESFPGVVYHHEPRRGIANARNAALEKALELGADFIAFTDDDAEPAEEWIAKLAEAQRETGAEVVRGRTVYTYPEPLPAWVVKPSKKPRLSAAPPRGVSSAPTNNVIFSAKLVTARGLNLRFDARFNTVGSEDTDFFKRARERGAKIVATEWALVHEPVVPERCTYRYQVLRQFQYATGNTIIDIDRGHYARVCAEGFSRVLGGLVWFVIATVSSPVSRKLFRKFAVRAGGKVLYGFGQISVLTGYRYEGYRVIEGH